MRKKQQKAPDVKVFIGHLDVVRSVREHHDPDGALSQPPSRGYRANWRPTMTIVPVDWSPLASASELRGRAQVAGMIDDADMSLGLSLSGPEANSERTDA